VTDPSALSREIAPLRTIDDNYPKYIITLEGYPLDDAYGIMIMKLTDWLMSG